MRVRERSRCEDIEESDKIRNCCLVSCTLYIAQSCFSRPAQSFTIRLRLRPNSHFLHLVNKVRYYDTDKLKEINCTARQVLRVYYDRPKLKFEIQFEAASPCKYSVIVHNKS